MTLGYLLLKPREKQRRRNPIDEWWTKTICVRTRGSVPNPDVWAECFYRVTFSLSDQQLVTGIAILTAAFRLRAQGSITALHFSIVRDLAFFSSAAHILSLLALWSSMGKWRNKHERKENGRRLPLPLVTIWRFICMLTFFGLLLAAIWITAFSLWDDWAGCPVRCIPKGTKNLSGVPFQWAVASTCFLVTEYTTYLMLFSEQILGPFQDLRTKCHTQSESAQDRLADYPRGSMIYRVCRKVALWARYLYFSELWDLTTVMAWSATNCVFVAQNRALSERVFGPSVEGRKERGKEDELGFGQIVPLLLLMLPVMTFISTYQGEPMLMRRDLADILCRSNGRERSTRESKKGCKVTSGKRRSGMDGTVRAQLGILT
jgi:hypothetical protein